MPIPIPTQAALRETFSPSSPLRAQQSSPVEAPRTRYQARSELYPAWSVVDDAKNKTAQLSDAAVKEFEKASSKAQATAGKIQLYTPKYYAACTFGGLLACVGSVWLAHRDNVAHRDRAQRTGRSHR